MENKKVVTEQNKAVAEHRKAVLEQKRALLKKKKMKRRIITALIACMMTLAGIAMGYALGRSNESPDIVLPNIQSGNKELSIMSLKEDGEWIIVNTSYVTLRYPFAFSDIIEVEAFNEGSASQLRFYSKMDDKRILNYIVHFNNNEGLPCGTLKLKEEIPVSVEFKEAPKKLSKEWLSTFYAVQETFNDVLKSLEENSNFSSVN